MFEQSTHLFADSKLSKDLLDKILWGGSFLQKKMYVLVKKLRAKG